MQDEQPTHSPAERYIARKREHEENGHQLSDRAMQSQRSLEGYLQAGNRPRWMERLGEIEASAAKHRRRLARVHEALRAEHEGDPAGFALRWRATAEGWDFAEHNELVAQHNEWFPIERQLAVDPRTRDYVKINGKDYRRPALGTAWVLEQFPAA